MKNRGVILILCSILISIIFFSLPFVEGMTNPMYPHVTFEITGNGQPINDAVLICTNEWNYMKVEWPNYALYWDKEGNEIMLEDRNYIYVKEGVESGEFKSCFYCNTYKERDKGEKCVIEVQGYNKKIAILYPAYEEYYHENLSVKKNPVLYKSDLSLPALATSPIVKVALEPEGNMILHSKININEETIFKILIALGITIFLELFFTFIYLLIKKWKVSKNLLLVVLLVNIISFGVVWFILSNIISNVALYLIFGEIFVVWLEGLLIRFLKKEEMSLKNSMILSFFMNLVSFVIGGFIFKVILSLYIQS